MFVNIYIRWYVHMYGYFYSICVYITGKVISACIVFTTVCLLCHTVPPNENLQVNLELEANCNKSGSKVQSQLQWNPDSINTNMYREGSNNNINFEYFCYSLSSSSNQVSTIIC